MTMASFRVQHGLRQTGQLQKAVCIYLLPGSPKCWRCLMIHLLLKDTNVHKAEAGEKTDALSKQ